MTDKYPPPLRHIVMVDKGQYSIHDLENRPLAGAQTAFIQLVKSFGNLGCKVWVRTNTEKTYTDEHIDWRGLSERNLPPNPDLLIANRDPALLSYLRNSDEKVLWIHNEAKYLLFWRNFKYILKYFPVIVFSGSYHKSTYPWPAPAKKKVVIPYGLSDDFKLMTLRKNPPPPKVIFTSNPLRELDWLIDRWVTSIYPEVPGAELHIYSGPATYGKYGRKMADRMNAVLDYARKHEAFGIRINNPIPKRELIKQFVNYRAMLYRGVKAETFCLAVAEAQGMGLPCVVQDIGSMGERVINGVTGFITKDDDSFVKKSIEVLTDDTLWKEFHQNSIESAKNLDWKKTAQQFLTLI